MLERINLNLPEADVVYYRNFFSVSESNHLFKHLIKNIKWQQDNITIFGKTHKQPRLTALYANNSNPYSYSGIVMHPHKFTEELLNIKLKIEQTQKAEFTSCLLNLYRNGNDSNGWHSDDEKELGKKPIIASVSFGAERIFHFRNKQNKKLKYRLTLENGSLLIMKGDTQHNWQHQLPKTKKKINERINLTYRIIK